MKKILLMAVVMLASVASYAQQAVGTFTLQPKIGMNVANITKSEGADPRIGLAAGVEAEYHATDIFSVSAGLIYSMQGAKTTEEVSGYTIDCTMKLDYLNVPILANVYVAPGLAVKLGVQPGFNLSAKIKGEASGASAEADVDGVKGFDLAIPVGVSYQYQNVVLDARYNWGVTKIMDDVDSKNSVFQITLGYKFAL